VKWELGVECKRARVCRDKPESVRKCCYDETAWQSLCQASDE